MDRAAAKDLVKDALERPFDFGRFAALVTNILNRFDRERSPEQARYPVDSYIPHIAKLQRLGGYEDSDGKVLDILVVSLKKETSLERARSIQRNYVARCLKGRSGRLRSGALVAFVAPNQSDWRFSLVKMEYRLDEEGKVRQDFTPARRYSFLVGEHERSHTAQSRLAPLLEQTDNPTLAQLEDAFSVEPVTEGFFKQYRALFLRLKNALDAIVKKNREVRGDFAEKKVDIEDFTKKLLGQIVFLYFLQKKGWLGVARGAKWGEGSKRFLRELFEKKRGSENFFNHILEPLFYKALREKRLGDESKRFKCRIPFLNGGLFDPLNDYGWDKFDILFDDALFANTERTKQGDTGTGILDVFDRYNFTVNEDEPLEKEVAVDPEMLGKVFENLLPVKDKKSKGAYYTPREIVHYMCQESLINYLATKLDDKASKADIEALIQRGDAVLEHDRQVANEPKKEKAKKKGRYANYHMPKYIRENADLIDGRLATIRVCDPAVGSGAFPVGMMNEIIRARNVLSNYIKGKSGRTPYQLKRHAIENCLYGVDIDASAVEIAKLRLWLSLVVDEEDRNVIQPLPNLDYKVVRGNALLRVERDLTNNDLFGELEALKPLFFNETDAHKKQQHKTQIDELIVEITNGRAIFDFEVYFSEVFHEKKGFDVVIANPPYVNVENISPALRKYIIHSYKTCVGRTDLYVAFLEKTLDLLGHRSIMTYIIPYAFTNQKYGAALRRLLIDRHHIKEILDTSEYMVFKNAVVRNIVLQVVKGTHESKTIVKHALSAQAFRSKKFDSFAVEQKKFLSMQDQRLETKNVSGLDALKSKLSDDCVKLADICFVGYGARLNHKHKKIGKDFYITDVFRPGLKPFHEGKNIERYKVTQKGWLNYAPKEHYNPMFPALFENEKLVALTVVKDRSRFALDKEGLYNSHTTLNVVKWNLLQNANHVSVRRGINHRNAKTSKCYDYRFLLAILNSSLLSWYFANFLSTKMNFYPETAKSMPIKRVSAASQKSVIGLVDKVLAAKSQNLNADTSALESEIDKLVYQLYNLTPEEIAIIENQ